MAFLDINPLNPGHTLVIPKKHYRWVIEVPQFGRYWEAVGRIGKGLINKLKADSLNFIVLGYEIPHAHVHIIPRFKNDDLGATVDWHRKKKLTTNQMEKIADKIREEVFLAHANNSESRTGRHS